MTLEQTRAAHPAGSKPPDGTDEAPFAALFRAESAAVLRYARTRVDAAPSAGLDFHFRDAL